MNSTEAIEMKKMESTNFPHLRNNNVQTQNLVFSETKETINVFGVVANEYCVP